MSKKVDSSDKKNVVVVGGSYGGSNAAKALAKSLDASKYNVILITARPFYLHLIAGIRMVVSDVDNLISTALVPYDKLQGITHKVGTVTSIEETAPGQGGVLVLKDGERVPYAGLVLATGSTWTPYLSFGDTEEEVRAHVTEWRSKFANAKHVLIIGGGPVGIGASLGFSRKLSEEVAKLLLSYLETAGEIKDAYPVSPILGSNLTLETTPGLLKPYFRTPR